MKLYNRKFGMQKFERGHNSTLPQFNVKEDQQGFGHLMKVETILEIL